MLDGEADALTRKAVDMALHGDTTALRLCLERIAPPRKDTTVQFECPSITSAVEAAEAAAAVLGAVAQGDLTPSEGSRVMALIEAFRRTLETSAFEARISALEEKV